MRKKLLLLLLCLIIPTVSLAANLPTPPTDFYVLDEVGVLEEETINYILDINNQLEEETGAQVVVAVVESLQGIEIEDYALNLFREWGIGDKDKNNGALLLVSPNDRKVRIEVGYGLEGAIPDSVAGKILDEYILPKFKEDDYDIGIKNGFSVIVDYISNEYDIEIDDLEDVLVEDEELLLFLLILIISLVIIFVIILEIISIISGDSGGGFYGGSSFGGSSGGSSGGGGFSGGGGASGGW